MSALTQILAQQQQQQQELQSLESPPQFPGAALRERGAGAHAARATAVTAPAHRATFCFDGLHPADLRRILLGFRQSPGGWKIATLLFSTSIVSQQQQQQQQQQLSGSTGNGAGVLLDSSVLNASLSVLAMHNRWQEAARLVQWRTECDDHNATTNSRHAPLRCNSATVSTAVKVLRQSPWHVALQVVSRLCATVAPGRPIDTAAASDVANMVLRLGGNAHWYHAAAAFAMLNPRPPGSRGLQSAPSSDPYSHASQADGGSGGAPFALEARTSSRLAVCLADSGHYALAVRAARYVRASGDAEAIAAALNALVLATRDVPGCDAWLTTMVEDGVEPTQAAREHLVSLHSEAGEWAQALRCVHDLHVPLSAAMMHDDEAGGHGGASATTSSTCTTSNNADGGGAAAAPPRRTITAHTHVRVQHALRAAGAPWDVAVRAFVALESESRNLPSASAPSASVRGVGGGGGGGVGGGGRSSGDAAEREMLQVAEAFRSAVTLCMEQGRADVGQGLLRLMIQKGVGR